MKNPLIIFFNDEKMVKSAIDQSKFLKKIRLLTKNNALQVGTIEEFETLINYLPEHLNVYVFIHIMGDALKDNTPNEKEELQGKSWAVSLKQRYPNCNFLFVTSNLSHATTEIYDNKPAHNITDLMDKIFVEKSIDFLPQKVKEIKNNDKSISQIVKSNEISKDSSINKVRIFIGSSKEGLNIARKIKSSLKHDAYVDTWEDGIFDDPRKTYIEILEDILDQYEYGIFVFNPDDKIYSRGKIQSIPRDNVIFEYGMFLGKHTRKRAFFIIPRGVDIKIMTDVLGIACLDYDPNNSNVKSAVNDACDQIRDILKDNNQ